MPTDTAARPGSIAAVIGDQPTGTPAYVTTPIYYVNAAPHLGHAYTTIAADILHRHALLNGHDAFFLTGTDEHGTNIARAASEAGMGTQAFTDMNSQRFRDLLPVIAAEPSFFIRTTDAEHERFVQDVLTRLHEQGDIYEATYSGPYCEPCEAYYKPDELLEGDLCPTHRRPVTTLEETNWFFRLSRYADRLLEHFDENPGFVWPRSRANEARSFIEQGLEDFSISRSTITWGVPLPWDESQVTYVWFDALLNYLSALTYAGQEDLTTRHWPATCQLLAKDILRFHAVSWPAILMALDYELPRRLAIHGYLLVGGDKMSKTQGNVFDPFELIERYGADPVRFYLMREVQFGQDGTVSTEGFEGRYTSELANDLGNLVSRTAAMVAKYLDGGVLPAPPAATGSAIAAAAEAAREAADAHLAELRISDALEATWGLVRSLNRHVEERAPWTLARSDDAADAQLLAATMSELAEGLVAVARQLWPFMPDTAVRIAAAFGVPAGELAAAGWGATTGAVVTRQEPLFPRIEDAGAGA